jgi:catechol 2,3-dioxygenase-like lactoylglutathione lyase family enzyme
MRIAEVVLPTGDLAAALAFWESLGVPVDPAAGAIRIGWTLLRLHHAATAPSHHLAITVPRNRYEDARDGLAERLPLLARDGQRDFPLPDPPWRSRSVYFSGPDDAVLELIARADLPIEVDGRAGAALLLGISEVGLVVDDGHAFATAVASRIGVTAFLPGTAEFQALGDQEGLLIGVEAGRPWLPTSDRLAAPGPLEVVLTGAPRAGELRSELGWSIRSEG